MRRPPAQEQGQRQYERVCVWCLGSREKKVNVPETLCRCLTFCKLLEQQTMTGHSGRMEHSKLRLDQVFSHISSKLVMLDDLDAAEATVHKNTKRRLP